MEKTQKESGSRQGQVSHQGRNGRADLPRATNHRPVQGLRKTRLDFA